MLLKKRSRRLRLNSLFLAISRDDFEMIIAKYLGKDENSHPVYAGWVDAELADVEALVASLEPDDIQSMFPGMNSSGIGKVGEKGRLVVRVRIDPKRAEERVTDCIEHVHGSKGVRGNISGGIWDTSISEEIIIELLEQILEMVRLGVHERE